MLRSGRSLTGGANSLPEHSSTEGESVNVCQQRRLPVATPFTPTFGPLSLFRSMPSCRRVPKDGRSLGPSRTTLTKSHGFVDRAPGPKPVGCPRAPGSQAPSTSFARA
jgi:hypothetical protein